jgi:hypothetical protein
MPNSEQIPERLYKYRSFSNLTLDMLIEDVIYFADPSLFNDPLDTKPTLSTDISAEVLERVLSQALEQRLSAEMSMAAKKIRYRGPKTIDHIGRLIRKETDKLLSDIRYDASDPEYEVPDPPQFVVGQYVERELLRRYDRGVFSLAERPNCPLMWSHYGDQHRGLCLGYSIPASAADKVHQIKYGGSRRIKASAVAAMLDGDVAARRKVDDAVLLRKAREWSYEKEWRLLGPKGPQDSPLELEEVVFGMRCSSTVKYSIMKALEDRQRPVRLYEIRERHGCFELDKRGLDDELAVGYPRRVRSVYEAFENLEVSVPSS